MPNHDPLVSNLPAQFTTRDAIVAALIADTYASLARAAATPSPDGEDAVTLNPNRVLRAQMMADLWINAAREAQLRGQPPQATSPTGTSETVRD